MNSNSFNLFPKLRDKQYARSVAGGVLFITTIIVMLALLINELLIYDAQVIQSVVNTNDLDQRVQVNLNISLHNTPCSALSLDIADMTGAHLLDVQHTLRKIRLIDGRPAAKLHQQQYGHNHTTCYGAELYEGQKCITCQDVMMAFTQRKWTLPKRESVNQCMPDGIATVLFDDYQHDYFTILNDQQEETLQGIKLKLSGETTNEDDDELPDPLMKHIMTDVQKNQFKHALSELSEIGYNPMLWDESKLKQEKGKRIDSIINMLNISLDHLGQNIANQLRFADREKIVNIKRIPLEMEMLTEIYRQKCDSHVRIYLNITLNDVEQKAEVDMNNNTCSIVINYKGTKQEDQMVLDVELADKQIQWIIGTNHSLMNVMRMEMDSVLVINDEYHFNYTPKAVLDKAYSVFRTSIYVPFQHRLLFTDQFQVETETDQTVFTDQIALIEEQLGEGCQFFGSFSLKKAPGKFQIGFSGVGQAAQYVSHNFSINHTIHHLQFTQNNEDVRIHLMQTPLDGTMTNTQQTTEDSYYLKIVSSTKIDMWQNKQPFYTFTSRRHSQSNKTLPSVIFYYDFDPISMQHIDANISKYIISVLAIIGGVYAMSAFIAQWLHVAKL